MSRQEALAAILTSEPYWLSLDQIAKLTDRQIQRVYFHRRTKEGKIDAEARYVGGKGEMTAAEENDAIRSLGAAFGLRPDKIQALMEKAKVKRQEEKENPPGALPDRSP